MLSRNVRLGLAAIAACMALPGVLLAQTSVGAGLSDGDRPVFVPINPCRLVDSRTGPNNVGPRSAPLGTDETITITAHGANGECSGASTIPSDALALSLNVTALGATQQTFLTFWGDGSNPGTANLNPAPGQPPTPNAVNTPLSPSGTFQLYNAAGLVNVVIDVNGYYAHHDHDDRYDTSGEVDAKIDSAIDALPEPPDPPEPPAPTRLTPEELGRLDWDADRGREIASSTGADPWGLAWDGTHIWAALEGEDAVAVIDPATLEEIDRVTVQDRPTGIAFDGARILVTNRFGNTLSVIDAATRTVIDHVATSPGPIAVASDDAQIYVAGGGSVTVIDAADLSVTTTVTGLPAPQGMAVSDGFLFIAANNGSRVDVLDTTDNLLDAPIAIGDSPRYIASTGTKLFVTNQGSSSVSVIDIATRTLIDTIVVGVSRQLIGIVYDGRDIWVSDNTNDELYRIDSRSHEIVEGPIDSGNNPIGMVYNGTNVFVANYSDNTIERWLPR